jgi:hypothetical protein
VGVVGGASRACLQARAKLGKDREHQIVQVL